MKQASPTDMLEMLVRALGGASNQHPPACLRPRLPPQAPRAATRAVRNPPGQTQQRRYDTWVFDCDGTLWRGQALIEGAADALQLLRDLVGFCPLLCFEFLNGFEGALQVRLCTIGRNTWLGIV